MADGFLGLLDLSEDEGDVFTARPPGSGFLFGGLVAAVSLRSAQLTAVDLHAHSLHAHFLTSGQWGSPIRVEVERTRNGKSFATRRIQATQNGTLLGTLTASFQRREEGFDWHEPVASQAPDPESLLDFDHLLGNVGHPLVDIRPADRRMATGEVPRYITPIHPYWSRVAMELPDDPAVHACGVVFISDFMVVTSAFPPNEQRPPNTRTVTIDHTIWLHRPTLIDDWHLFSAVPSVIGSSRTLIRGSVTNRVGLPIATFSQEAVTRPVREDTPWVRTGS